VLQTATHPEFLLMLKQSMVSTWRELPGRSSLRCERVLMSITITQPFPPQTTAVLSRSSRQNHAGAVASLGGGWKEQPEL
jgi:hypothetical protein